MANHTQLFARIRLHGLTKTFGGKEYPIILERMASFPAPLEVLDVPPPLQDVPDLSSRPLAPEYEMEVRVRFDESRHPTNSPRGSLGAGRAGLVYPLEVMSVRRLVVTTSTSLQDEASLNPCTIPLPPLCIKIATPGYGRALAREAWFYEQFDANGLTGILTPRCYGVFRASLSDAGSPTEITIDIPEYDYHEAAEHPILPNSCFYTAAMAEEGYGEKTNNLEALPSFVDDSRGSYSSSPWTALRETPGRISVTVLIIDQLGDTLTVETMDKNMYVAFAQALFDADHKK